MEDREDGGFDVSDNEFQETSVSDRIVSDEVSYDAANVYVEPAVQFLERVNTYLGGEARDAQIKAENILRQYTEPESFGSGFVDADEAVRLLEMEIEQAREINNVSGEIEGVVEELEEAYELVQSVYDECSERNILSHGVV